MKTNDFFNFRRFGKYFSSEIRTCWSNYGLSLMTLSLLFPVSLYFVVSAFNLIVRSNWDGPDMGLRTFIFTVAMICIVVTMPVKCYGRITEKQYGSFWLTLPASGFEKFISMFLMTCFIVPVIGSALYLGADAIICAIDHTCGRNLIAGGIDLLGRMGEMQDFTLNFMDEGITIEDAAMTENIIRQIGNPWMYVDEIFGITLPFLLGAICFKNGKTVKTFLAIFAFSMATSMMMTPFMSNWAAEIVSEANSDPMAVLNILDSGVFRNLTLVDTISDTIVNLALLAGIWFRIKTLKH